MKRKLSFLFFLWLGIVLFSLSISAVEGTPTALERAVVSEDGTVLTVSATLSEETAAKYDRVYLFRVTPDSSSIERLTPVAEAVSTPGQVVFSVSYDLTDHTAPLYGYVLGGKEENGSYLALSEPIYAENFTKFAHNTSPYPEFSSKKGLMVQYIADAQLLGVKHSIVPVYFNDLVTEDEEDAVTFLYGGIKYYLDADALATLDYRVKSLSDAGIHVYMNFLLSYDASAPDILYYPKAEGYAGRLCAPNVSSPEGVRCFAAVMHFLAERYSMPEGDYGFCGSYILGYEINEEGESHQASLASFQSYLASCEAYLRTAHASIRSAYNNARLYLSFSNRWNLPDGETEEYLFGACDLLTALASSCADISFGVAVNPYPSSLSLGDYWHDEKATDELTTEYLTMKNLSVLTDYLTTEALLYEGQPRSVVVAEFGVSGKLGEESEMLQAAAYAYAYDTVLGNERVEAFLWHRHVDHESETDLYYGLYSSSELLLDPAEPKLLYDVFSVIDTDDAEAILESLLPLLPVSELTLLSDSESAERTVVSVAGSLHTLSDSLWEKETLFDFSKSLYRFYPTDNALYLDQVSDGEDTFLRAALLCLSGKEYMGIGIALEDVTILEDAGYLSVRLRIGGEGSSNDLLLLLSGDDGEKQVSLRASQTVTGGKWTTVYFPLDGIDLASLSEPTLKLWVRSDRTKGDTVTLDVSSVCFFTEKNILPQIIFLLLLGMAVVGALVVTVVLTLRHVKGLRFGHK